MYSDGNFKKRHLLLDGKTLCGRRLPRNWYSSDYGTSSDAEFEAIAANRTTCRCCVKLFDKRKAA